jgi:hypothetical protein
MMRKNPCLNFDARISTHAFQQICPIVSINGLKEDL